MKVRMYVHKDFYDIISFLSTLEGRSKVDITKEIASYLERKMSNDKYNFKLFR